MTNRDSPSTCFANLLSLEQSLAKIGGDYHGMSQVIQKHIEDIWANQRIVEEYMGMKYIEMRMPINSSIHTFIKNI